MMIIRLHKLSAILLIAVSLLIGKSVAGTTSTGESQSDEPDMVLILGGSFEMGSPMGEPGRDEDERLHSVRVTDFYLAVREVTRGEFRKFVNATGYRTDAEKNSGGNQGCFAYRGGSSFGWKASLSWRDSGYIQSDGHPVVCVSWNDAMAYFDWLSSVTGKDYRLPTEAEWEYAARAGAGGRYSFGENESDLCRYGNVADRTARLRFSSWTITDCDDGHVFSAPVGEYLPNQNGIYDMHGNVWEWTCSMPDRKYSGSEVLCADRSITSVRVNRGGSFSYGPNDQRLAYRSWNVQSHRFGSLGFRAARTKSPQSIIRYRNERRMAIR